MTIFDEELADTIEAARIRRYGVARYRELRLRQRIDDLLTERGRLRAQLSGKQTLPRRCVYCGAEYRGRVVACAEHADLLEVDTG